MSQMVKLRQLLGPLAGRYQVVRAATSRGTNLARSTAPAVRSQGILGLSANGISPARGFFSKGPKMEVGSNYDKGQQDSSTKVEMQAPFGHDENRQLATQLGIYKVYEYSDMGRTSRVTVAFQSRRDLDLSLHDVEKFMEADNQEKLRQVPEGKINATEFPAEVTSHFSELKVPFTQSIFRSNREGMSDTLVFAFATPGGFWTIGWYVPAELFAKEPDLFFLFIQSIKLVPTPVPE
mmetsp:Transcript_43413/g.67991  ORF Transcript_43413/g.67991 Transcript_43413/m.67991 type:complete len:236 (-) Transcript_43413:30-737(-)